MNVIHLKYAVEVAEVGSINKASENLNMAQPNISRAIKDLESDLKITIFDRSAKGMNLTPEGKEFILYAKKILSQLNELEVMFKGGMNRKQKFSVSVPRAGYIAEAFALFSNTIDGQSADIIFDENDTLTTVKKIINSDCRLGIIRFQTEGEKYFKNLLEENSVKYDTLSNLKYVLVMGKENPLANKEKIYLSDLKDQIQLTHEKPYAATLTMGGKEKDDEEHSKKRIYIFDSAAQLEILSVNKNAFMWVSPTSDKLLDRYGLVQRVCEDWEFDCTDLLIYKKETKFNDLEKEFINELNSAAERYL